MRRLKYIETGTMKVILCDCLHVTGFDHSVLYMMKRLPICRECGKVLNIKRYFKELTPLLKVNYEKT